MLRTVHFLAIVACFSQENSVCSSTLLRIDSATGRTDIDKICFLRIGEMVSSTLNVRHTNSASVGEGVVNPPLDKVLRYPQCSMSAPVAIIRLTQFGQFFDFFVSFFPMKPAIVKATSIMSSERLDSRSSADNVDISSFIAAIAAFFIFVRWGEVFFPEVDIFLQELVNGQNSLAMLNVQQANKESTPGHLSIFGEVQFYRI